jgi:hypothetical protein
MEKEEDNKNRLERVQLTQQEWWAAQRRSVTRNRKRYRRKGRDQDRWRKEAGL